MVCKPYSDYTGPKMRSSAFVVVMSRTYAVRQKQPSHSITLWYIKISRRLMSAPRDDTCTVYSTGNTSCGMQYTVILSHKKACSSKFSPQARIRTLTKSTFIWIMFITVFLMHGHRGAILWGGCHIASLRSNYSSPTHTLTFCSVFERTSRGG